MLLISVRFFLSVFLLNFLLTPASYALAADLNFSSNTTLNLTGVSFSTFTVASGSAATSLTVGETTLSVTVPSGGTFTVNASADITFTNAGGIATICGVTSSIAVTGPVTALVITPTNTVCAQPAARSSVATPTPSSPTNVKAVATSGNVTITWTDPPASQFSSIIILRNGGGTSPIPEDPYATIMKKTQTFSDANVKAGETYTYLVRSRNSSGATDGNNMLITATIPIPPAVKAEEPKKEDKKEEEKKSETKREEIVEPKKEEVVAPKEEASLSIRTIIEETKMILSESTETIARSVGKVADPVIEQSIKSTEKFAPIISAAEEEQTTAVVGFITYGTQSTLTLGEGERAGVLDSYRKTYGALPTTQIEWQDAMRIASGQLPEQANASSEAKAMVLFKTIYKRSVKTVASNETVLKAKDGNDYNALRIAAYGVRPEIRDLEKERGGIGIFKSRFGNDPKSAEDWDAVRMIAYSGVAPP